LKSKRSQLRSERNTDSYMAFTAALANFRPKSLSAAVFPATIDVVLSRNLL